MRARTPMSTTQAEVRQLKEGRYVVVDEQPCKILSISTSKPGKHGAAKAKIDTVGIFDGVRRSFVAPVSDKCKIPIIDKKKAQVINISGKTVNLMDLETYAQFEITTTEHEVGQLQPGQEIMTMEAMGRRAFMGLDEEET